MATFNLADMFELVADRVTDWEAIITETRRISYGELEQRANRLANYLKSRGVKAGDHIGLQLMNGNEYIEGMLAAYKLRAVPVNINYNYVEAELRYIYDDADLVAMLIHRQFTPKAAAVVPEMSKLSCCLVVEDSSGESVPDGWAEYEDALTYSSAKRDFDRTQGPIKEADELPDRLPETQFATLAAPPFMHAAGQWMALLQMFSGGKLVIPAHGRFDV